MKKSGYYSSGKFARKAHVTKKTLRYYDEHNILKPCLLTSSGARLYNDDDLRKLQQILLLKYLGFSLSDIREMTINKDDRHYLKDSLVLQKKLVEDRIEQLQIIDETLRNTIQSVDNGKEVDWSKTLDVVQMMGMEQSLKNQYLNASNISSRIYLHNRYSQNSQGWFPWVFEQCNIDNGMRILEIGCGDGTFWVLNKEKLPIQCKVLVSDLSAGMLRDARRNIESEDERFDYRIINGEAIPFTDNSYERVIANHVLFYCQDVSAACSEISRVLHSGGLFICSTYGADHMREISELVREFDDRIVLSANRLYEKFGKANGKGILASYFSKIEWKAYSDELIVTEPEPLISYILSCHGNQTQYILDHYNEFRQFVKRKTEQGFHITKDAGVFICEK